MTRPETSIAVFGCGVWGVNHLRVWNELGCLRTACDPNQKRLESVLASYPLVEPTGDPGEVFARPDITAVVIATPASTHHSLALQALNAGKDVLVEKPLALNTVEGEQLVDVAQRSGGILMVGHLLEYHPAILKLQDLIKSNVLGTVRYLYSNRLNFGRIRREENVLWSFAPHDVGVMLRLLGKEPRQLACYAWSHLNRGVADSTLTAMDFADGVSAHIFVSWLHPFREQRFIVVGDLQMAVFNDSLPWPEKLSLYPHRVDWVSGEMPVAHKAEAVNVPLDEVEPLRAECEHILRCIDTRQQPLTDGHNGVQILKVPETAQASMEQGGIPMRLGDHSTGALPYKLHPTAAVDQGAEIGEGTEVWHYRHVMSGARLGRKCVVGQNVFVGRDVRIGDNVKIQNNVSVYTGVQLEDDVFCGPSCVFTNVINPRSQVPRRDQYQPTLVRRGATIGANTTIICGATIGRYAFLGAGAVVRGEVPDYALMLGVPATNKGWMSRHGHRLQPSDHNVDLVCPESGWRYKEVSPGVLRCLDWPEDKALPENGIHD